MVVRYSRVNDSETDDVFETRLQKERKKNEMQLFFFDELLFMGRRGVSFFLSLTNTQKNATLNAICFPKRIHTFSKLSKENLSSFQNQCI
jgi:hypothetical protein